VKINGSIGGLELCPEGIGIAQGSLLGPLLYLIYVNDIVKLPTTGSIRCYADDTSLFYDVESLAISHQCITYDLQLVTEYMRMNRLTLNINKSTHITFHTRFQKISNGKSLNFNGMDLKTPVNIKHLGIVLDKHLTFDPHIEKLRKKISPLVGILYRIRQFTPKNILMAIFNAHIQSHLAYLASVYTSATNSALRPLQVLQNRALKIIHRLPPWHSSEDLFKNEVKNVLPVKGLGIMQTCTFVRKIMKKEVHSNIKFERFSTTHTTRNVTKEKLKPAKYRSNMGSAAISHQGPKLFNSLKEHILEAKSMKVFKKRLKTHLIQERIDSILCTKPRLLSDF
jgi:Reverse transcriptase (RNA-dependent DNA polymerase)